MPIPARIKFLFLIITLFSILALFPVRSAYSQNYQPETNATPTSEETFGTQNEPYETKLAQAETNIPPIIPLLPYIFGFGRILGQAGIKTIKDVAQTTLLASVGDIAESGVTVFASWTIGEDYACNMIPYDKEKCKEYVNPSYYEKVPPTAYGNSSLLSASTTAVGTFYTSPINETISVSGYLKNTLGNNLLSSPTYAQTQDKTGREYLNAVLGWWVKMRNVAYSVYLIILVLIGFMIMVRKRLDPRTTVSLVNSLPGIVVSLILITFSFPIAGLIIDLGFLVKALIDNLFPGAAFAGIPGWGINAVEALRTAVEISPVIIGVANTWVLGLLIKLIMSIMIIVIFLKLFVILLTRWAAIFVRVIFAPLIFLVAAIPGQGSKAGEWFKKITTDVMVLPAVYFLIRLGLSIGSWSLTEDLPIQLPLGLGFVPLTEYNLTAINALVGFGIIAGATKVPELIESVLDIMPSAHVARAGVEAAEVFRKIPILGGIFK